MRLAGRLLALCFVLVAGCDGGTPARVDAPQATTTSSSASSPDPATTSLRLEDSPVWMSGYCRKAADDLGYAVLCPRKLPRPIDIIPCGGPAPEEDLWGEYCFDFVLDVLFRGPRNYPGLFRGPGRRTGHLAIWTIGPDSDLYPDGLFACPGGGHVDRREQLGTQAGSWWTCPSTHAANLNTGHIAFQ